MAEFHAYRAFQSYRATGLSAFEAGVGERFDIAVFKATGEVAYGLGLLDEHANAFLAAIVTEGNAYLARVEAAQKAAAATAAVSARTSSGAELADALTARAAAVGGLQAHDVALLHEAARRLRAR